MKWRMDADVMVIYRAPKWLFRALRKHAGAIGAFTNVLTATISDVAFLRKIARGCLSLGVRKLMLAA